MLYRRPLPSTTVTVESNPVQFTGQIIKSTATREPQECVDWVEIWTQPVKRARPVEYQIRLRTLSSRISKDSWREPVYSDYQRVEYEADPANPGFLRLALSESSLELDQKLLLEGWSSSPRDQPKHVEDIANIKADTFDWRIPVNEPFSVDKPFDQTLVELRANGWLGGQDKPQSTISAPGGIPIIADENFGDAVAHPYTNFPYLYWKPGREDWDGQHRDIKTERVSIEYSLDWTADRLRLTIKNNPSQRNYVVFVVVEEKMPGSGKILHTAVALPVNGLLTYVPQKFFDDELAAHARTAGVIAGLIAKHIPSVHDIGPPPPDPVFDWVRPGDLVTRDGINRILALAKDTSPSCFDRSWPRACNEASRRQPSDLGEE